VTTSAIPKLLARECLTTNAASTRKQNAAVDAESQPSCQPSSADPSSTGPVAASSQYSELLRLLVRSSGVTNVFITHSDDQ
jgi:hypothetical protein